MKKDFFLFKNTNMIINDFLIIILKLILIILLRFQTDAEI